MMVPGGGIWVDGERWIGCRPGLFLPVRVLSRLFRRLVLEKLAAAHGAGALQFFGKHAALIHAQAFAAYLAPLRNSEWVVYSKRPFGGPADVLRYLARYTHRVAISNRRLVALDDKGVTFKWKDYRLDGPQRYNKLMTLDTPDFIPPFLIHAFPQASHPPDSRWLPAGAAQPRVRTIHSPPAPTPTLSLPGRLARPSPQPRQCLRSKRPQQSMRSNSLLSAPPLKPP